MSTGQAKLHRQRWQASPASALSRLANRTMRAFIAIELPPAAKEAVRNWQKRAEKSSPGLYNWTNQESLHLTLYYLGDMEEEDLLRISNKIEFRGGVELSLGSPMVFPEPTVPKILALELLGDVATLKGQQQKLHDTVFAVANHQETRPFRPHITVGRLKRNVPPSAKPVKRLVGSLEAPDSLKWTVNEVLIYESKLQESGSSYIVRHRIPVSG